MLEVSCQANETVCVCYSVDSTISQGALDPVSGLAIQEEHSTMASNHHHTINYIEFYAVDLAEATRFYGAAFGWQFTEYGTDYVGIRNRDTDGECGGICRTDKVFPGGPLVILYSEDLESSLATVQKAGGKITKEIFSFPGGRRFHFSDPCGNELAVWSDQAPATE
jgi:predicted enzyme related to lactoylglutathione lyase